MKFGYNLSWEKFMELFPGIAPVLIPIVVLLVIVTVAAIISLLRKKLPFSQTAIWLIIIIFTSILGSVIYFTVGSKMLDEKAQNGGHER